MNRPILSMVSGLAAGSILLAIAATAVSTDGRHRPDQPAPIGEFVALDRTQSVQSVAPLDEPEVEAVWVGATRWMRGINWGGETFFGSWGKGINFFGSSLGNADYVPVRVEFSNSTTSLCRTFRRDLGYASSGVGAFPGAAYDVTDPMNPRRLNLCLVEDNTLGAANLTWDPSANASSPIFGKREYVAVMLSSYDGDGSTYNGFDFNDDAFAMDVLYSWWPLVEPGFTLLQVLPAAIDITPYLVKNFRSIPDDGAITLTWQYYADPDSFRIYGEEITSPATQWLGTVPGTAREFTHSGVTNGVVFHARVDAFSGGAKTGASRELTTTPGSYGVNMTRFGVWNERSNYGGIWGYVDSASGDEYALICCRDEGVAIIDVNVTPPVEVGFMPSITPGRDAKEVQVYRHYAVITKENEPLQIFDLTDVTNPVQVSVVVPDNNGSHTNFVDGDYLYVLGNHTVGGLEIFDISNPAAPSEVGGYQPYYYHDIAVRNDTVYAFAIYGQGVDVIDVSNKNAPSLITTFNYPGSGTHNGAITADGRYLYIGDEIGTSGNHTRIFDISDINNVGLVGHIIVDPLAVAHNCYIRDELLFIAHYTEGCRVFDISDPVNPVEVASYDTWEPPTYGYDGMWTAYPLLPSGKIICSDRTTGLWVCELELPGGCTCPCAYDPMCDGVVSDVSDVVGVINVAFRGMAATTDGGCPYERSDVNASGATDVLDVLAVINVAFRGGAVASNYVDPCL